MLGTEVGRNGDGFFPPRPDFQMYLHERWREDQPFDVPHDLESFLERAWPASFHARDLQDVLVEHGQQFNKMEGLVMKLLDESRKQSARIEELHLQYASGNSKSL